MNLLCLLSMALVLPSWAWLSHSYEHHHQSLKRRKGGRAFSTAFFQTDRPGRNSQEKTTTSLLFMADGEHVDSSKENMGLNELQTLLRNAVKKEDFTEAGRLSDILATRLYGDINSVDENTRRLRRRKMSWPGLGAAPWLVDRLDSLNYTFPTTIQINAMEAANAILNTTNELVESTSLEERMDINNENMGICVSGNTGSGTPQLTRLRMQTCKL